MPCGLIPSSEQDAIVEASASGESFRILAFAGTGKTTTMQFLAEALTGKRVLYLTFNKAQARIAQDRFASLTSVTACTAHSLAYRNYGKHCGKRLQANGAERVWHDFLNEKNALSDVSAPQRNLAGRTVIETLRRFIASAAPAITESLVPETSPLDRAHIAALARRLWKSIATNDRLPMSHDWYLKAWQLTKPAIATDVVLFDEAQDSTPAMLDIVTRQIDIQSIFCGDPHQQLYEFRGAVNALDSIDLPSLALTKTRRFGSEIAKAANAILEAKGERLRMIGSSEDAGKTATGYPDLCDVVLARSNTGLVERALTLIEQKRRIFIRGSTDEHGRAGNGAGELMASILSAFDLKQGLRSTHPAFSSFECWDDFRETAMNDGGEQYRPFVRLVEQHGADVRRVVALIRDNSAPVEAQADVVLSTVHRFKGEEAGSIVLAPDFRPFAESTDAETHASTDTVTTLDTGEANIAYVACTRAQRELWYGGAFAVLYKSLKSARLTLHVTPVVPVARPAYAPLTRPVQAPPAPLRRTYRELVPGSFWNHPHYGIVTIVDADHQLITIETTAGECLKLGTLGTYPKLSAMTASTSQG